MTDITREMIWFIALQTTRFDMIQTLVLKYGKTVMFLTQYFHNIFIALSIDYVVLTYCYWFSYKGPVNGYL
jgi:hypothetical protein